MLKSYTCALLVLTEIKAIPVPDLALAIEQTSLLKALGMRTRRFQNAAASWLVTW